MKTTLDISDELLMRAKQAALERKTTLRAIVEDALRRTLGPTSAPVPLRSVVWPQRPTTAGDEVDWAAQIDAGRAHVGGDADWLAKRLGKRDGGPDE